MLTLAFGTTLQEESFQNKQKNTPPDARTPGGVNLNDQQRYERSNY